MRVSLRQQITLEEVKQKLEKSFPAYQFHFRTKNLLVAKKSKTIGSIIMAGKMRLSINEGFPTMGGQLLFVACILFLCVAAPIIVYYTAFFPAQRKLAKELNEFLKREYAIPLPAK